MTAEQIVDKILDPFEEAAPMLTAMASGMSPEQLIEFMEANVPGDWAIMSPKGEELITTAFEIWQSDGEEGAA